MLNSVINLLVSELIFNC